MDITIPEALLLLSLDDERGTSALDASTLPTALTAAAITQLLADERVRVAGEGEPGAKPGTLVAASGATDARLEPLVDRIAGHSLESALRRATGLGGASSPIGRVHVALLADFADAGVLEQQRDRFLGLTWRERWERGDRRDVEDAVQQRADAVLDGAEDAPVAAALAILHGATVLPTVFPEREPAALEARGAQLAEGSWASERVAAAVQSMYDTMTTVMFTTVILPAATGR